jgi:GNAT superfamily N-acetyltransferase
MSEVVTLDATMVPEVVDVIHESFFDYPVMRFVLGDAGADYSDRLRTLVHFFVMARVFRDEVLLGAPGDGGLIGAALISRPGGPEPDPGFYELRERVWGVLGPEARDRYSAFGSACAPFQPEETHLHLNMIGVRRTWQGKGISRLLIEKVHGRSLDDPTSAGVSLTTENPRNVSLYRHYGYDLVGEAVVGPGLTTWGFYRRDDA